MTYSNDRGQIQCMGIKRTEINQMQINAALLNHDNELFF